MMIRNRRSGEGRRDRGHVANSSCTLRCAERKRMREKEEKRAKGGKERKREKERESTPESSTPEGEKSTVAIAGACLPACLSAVGARG